MPVLFLAARPYNNSMKKTVYTNATIVTALSVATRGLGFLYRIVLSRFIGAEGLGLYQVAFSLFGLFATIGAGGIPITVSRMITKAKAQKDPYAEKQTVSAGLILCLLLSLPTAFLFGFLGHKFVFLFTDKRTFKVFQILIVGLVFASVYAVLRGSFWGNKEFLTPSILETAEEALMVIIGVMLLQNVSSPVDGAQKAAWAVTLSCCIVCIAALLCFFNKGGALCAPKNTLKPLFNATLPITSVRAGGSLVNSAIAVLLPAMLIKAGLNETQALKLFGIVSGMVIPVLFMPSTLIGSLALVLVPELAEDYYKSNQARLRKNILRGLKFSVIVACSLIPLLFSVGGDVGKIAFSNATAGKIIEKSCILLLPMSVTMISTSILNSLGFEKQTFLYYFLGAAALLLCILILPQYFGAYAYCIGLGASFSINAVCNLVLLWKKGLLFEKGRGQVWIQQFLPTLLLTIPICFLGRRLANLCKQFFGEPLATILTALIVLSLSLLLLLIRKLFKRRPTMKNR